MKSKIPAAAFVVSVATAAALAATPGAAVEAAGGAVITMVGDYPVRYDRYGDGLTEAVQGTATTLTVDYSGAEPGTFTIDWSCGTDNGGWEHRLTSQIPDDAPDGVIVYPIDTTEPSLSCTFLLQQDQVTGYVVKLLQLDPVLATSHFENSTGPVVYPRVHSDWWRAGFQTNSPAEITTSVRNQHGRLVFTGTSGAHRLTYGGDQSRDWAARVAWNGHRANGTLAPLGTYRVVIRVRSTRGSGAVRIGPLRVSVKPGRRPVTVRATQSGVDSRAIAAGGCDLAEQPGSGGVLALDCGISSGSPRALAKATWTFRVPRTAKLIGWRIRGFAPVDDNPDIGTVRRTLTHPRPTVFKIQMRLTGQRSFVVTGVILEYRYLK